MAATANPIEAIKPQPTQVGGLDEITARMNPVNAVTPGDPLTVDVNPEGVAKECGTMAEAMYQQTGSVNGTRAMGGHADPEYLFKRTAIALTLARDTIITLKQANDAYLRELQARAEPTVSKPAPKPE